MKSRYRKIKDLDFNSYYVDSPIEIDKGALLFDIEMNKVLLQLRFNNVSDKRVNSVHISVECFDDTGDPIPGINLIEHAYQDLSVDTRSSFGDKEPIILDRRVRNVRVVINKVSVDSGETWRNIDAEDFTSPKQESINDLGLDLVDQLNRQVKVSEIGSAERIKFFPIQNDDNWICSCGRYNPNDSDSCIRCGITKDWIFSNIDRNYLTMKLSEFRENRRIETENQKRLAEEAEKRRIENERIINDAKTREKNLKERKRKKYILLSCILGAILIILGLIYKMYMVPRQEYSRGITLYENGEFSSAISVFEELGEYKDTKIWLNNAKLENDYNIAMKNLKYANYEIAISQLSALNGFKNSDEMLNNARYEYAVQLFNKKYFYEARLFFNKVTAPLNVSQYLDSLYYSIEGKWKDTSNKIISYSIQGGGKMQVTYDGKYYVATWDNYKEYVFREEVLPNSYNTFKIIKAQNTPGGSLYLEQPNTNGWTREGVFISK